MRLLLKGGGVTLDLLFIKGGGGGEGERGPKSMICDALVVGEENF